MNFTHPAHKEMIVALLENQVEFILVGGYAVIYHGYVRATGAAVMMQDKYIPLERAL